MLTVSNALSFFRFPLALLFLVDSPPLRLLAVFLAMITDSVDGYLARRNQSVSRFGAILDPAADKFFVYFALVVLSAEARLLPWEAVLMLSRDIVISAYGIFMTVSGRWKKIVLRPIHAGKISTALQFIILIGLVLKISFSTSVYSLFAVMGGLAFIELFYPLSRDIVFSKSNER